jgi:hypothetical protein
MTGIFGILESSATQWYQDVAPIQEIFCIVTSIVYGVLRVGTYSFAELFVLFIPPRMSWRLQMVEEVRKNFAAGVTRSLKFRRGQLRALLECIEHHEEEWIQALHADLRKVGGPTFCIKSFAGSCSFLHIVSTKCSWPYRTLLAKI